MSKLQARLLIEAVLPALTELPPYMFKEAGIRPDWEWAAAFALRLAKPVAVKIQGHKVEVERRKARKGELNLLFMTPDSLVQAFSGKTPNPPPIPTGGFGKLKGLKRFDSLGKQLKRFLESAKAPDSDPAALRAAFGVLARALPILVAEDPKSKNALLPFKPTTAWVSLKPLDFEFSVIWDGQELQTIFEKPQSPSLDLSFESLDAVRGVTSGSMDLQAAVGSGDVRLVGDVLFAEAVGIVMDRADQQLRL